MNTKRGRLHQHKHHGKDMQYTSKAVITKTVLMKTVAYKGVLYFAESQSALLQADGYTL